MGNERNGDIQISKERQVNLVWLERLFGEQADLQKRMFQVAGREVVMIYFTSLCDSGLIVREIVQPLMQNETQPSFFHREPFVDWLCQSVLPVSVLQRETDWMTIRSLMYQGYVLIMVDQETQGIVIPAKRNLTRAIEASETEFVERGSRAAFVEDSNVNLALIRNAIKSPKLRTQSFAIGNLSEQRVYMISVDEKASPELLEEVTRRLQRIQTESVLEIGELEEWIEDNHFSPFEQTLNTERADICARHLLNGKVVLLLEGNPSALIVPVTFDQLFHFPSDYDQRAYVGTLKRMFRYIGFFVSTNLSAIYIAMIGFHSHLIPIKLIGVLEAKRETVPFPPLFEILVMQLILDLILESILRLPSKLSQIIGVSSAIIVGQTAVSTQLISPAIIIVVAITTITGFTQARMSTNFSFQIIRYMNLLLTSFLGAFGLMVTWMFWLIHLCSLHPFGHAYLDPISPLHWNVVKDGLIRLPVTLRNKLTMRKPLKR